MKLAFTVPGAPVPIERARVMRNQLPDGRKVTRTITPDRSAAYRERVQWSARAAMARARWTLRDEDRYALTCRVFWSDARRRDGSNLLKAIEDAGNGPPLAGRLADRRGTLLLRDRPDEPPG